MNALNKGFYTTTRSDVDKLYEIRLSFHSAEELEEADRQLRSVFKREDLGSILRKTPVSPDDEYHIPSLKDLLGPLDRVRSITVEDVSRKPPNEST